MKKLNNKGFAITAVAYTLFVFFVLLIMLILLLLRNLDTSLTTLTKDIKESINNIKYIDGTVEITGETVYGETLIAVPTITTLTEEEIEKLTYTYKWYSNDIQSIENATEITDEVSDQLSLRAAQYEKYICVEVIVNTDNYDSEVLRACTSSQVVQRPITVTAGSSSKVYDGTALTNSVCTASNLGFEHTVVCTMTSESTITDVGSVNNEISSIIIYANNGTSKVTKFYDITMVDGTLTITSS